jgi:hypothetical protein
MSEIKPVFQPVEIDELDRKLSETAVRKQIPSLKVADQMVGTQEEAQVANQEAKPVHRPASRKPLSLEVPDYLATELKIAAARQSVTIRHLVLTALGQAGYEIQPIDMDEDGRRLR